jgi:hypothetical protein
MVLHSGEATTRIQLDRPVQAAPGTVDQLTDATTNFEAA